jgi:hypothetical protein
MKSLLLAAATAALLFAPQAQAQLHEGDIELSVVAGRIALEGNDAWHANGLAVFEADFGDTAGGPYRTDDPGYDSAPGTFAAGAILDYAALGSLMFWNGAQWQATVPGNEYVRLDGNLGEDTRWSVGGVTGDLTGLIGQAGANGQIHEHLDMSVARVGGGVPAVGAYLIQLQLTMPALVSSEPFYVAINRGLAAADFEMAVQALAVPEAQSWAMLTAGMLLLACARRRRVR